jgi:tetratricopeptide (TPR) repeat protein
MRSPLLISILLVAFNLSGHSQTTVIDSLLTRIQSGKADTSELIDLYKLSERYVAAGEYENSLDAANKAISLADELIRKASSDTAALRTSKSYKSKALSSSALNHTNLGNYTEALAIYNQSLKIRQELNEQKGIASNLNNMGTLYQHQGNYAEALKYYFSSLKIKEKIGEKKSIANTYNNIGNVYNAQKNYSLSIKNHVTALKLRKEIGDQTGIASSYNNIGNVYFAQALEEMDNDIRQGLLELSLNNNHSSLKISEAIEDQNGMANSYINIGAIWFNRAEHEKNKERQHQMFQEANKHFKISLQKRELIDDKNGLAGSHLNIGSVFLKEKDLQNASKHFAKAKQLAAELGIKEYLKEVYSALTAVDSSKGDFRAALEHNKLFLLYRDSLDNAETRKKMIQSQMTYDFEKKEAVENAEREKELENQKLLAGERNLKQTIIIIFIAGILIAAVIFLFLMFKSLRLTRKQKQLIDEQKQIVEAKQKEILDSIHYARRIQFSLLPGEVYINKNLLRLKSKNNFKEQKQ